MPAIRIDIENEHKNKPLTSRKKEYYYKYFLMRKVAHKDYTFTEEEKQTLAQCLVDVNESMDMTNIETILMEDNHYIIILTTQDDEGDISLVVNKIGTLLGRKVTKNFEHIEEEIDGKMVEKICFENFSCIKGKLWADKYFINTYHDPELLGQFVQGYLRFKK